VLPVKAYFSRVMEGFFQDYLAVNRLPGAELDVIDQNVRQVNRRHKLAEGNFAGVKGIETIYPAKIEQSVTTFAGSVAVKLVALQAVGGVKVTELACPGVKARKAAVGAEPEVAVVVFKYGVDDR